MEKTLFIQNMVCDRCKATVQELIHKNGGKIQDLQLGRVVIVVPDNFEVKKLETDLKENGFELIKNPDDQLSESIKVNLIKLIDNNAFDRHLSEYLSTALNREYSVLSKTFKKTEGETIEKYFIKLKIEKVKELIQMGHLNFSEIAYQLGYNSISHLSGQFKSTTGMTMSEYQKSQKWNRNALDKIL